MDVEAIGGDEMNAKPLKGQSVRYVSMKGSLQTEKSPSKVKNSRQKDGENQSIDMVGKNNETEIQKADINKAVKKHDAKITKMTSVKNGGVHVSRRLPAGIKPKGIAGKRRRYRGERQEVEVEINGTQKQQKEMTATDQVPEASVETLKKDVKISMINDLDNDEEVCGGKVHEEEGASASEIFPAKKDGGATPRDEEVFGGEAHEEEGASASEIFPAKAAGGATPRDEEVFGGEAHEEEGASASEIFPAKKAGGATADVLSEERIMARIEEEKENELRQMMVDESVVLNIEGEDLSLVTLKQKKLDLTEDSEVFSAHKQYASSKPLRLKKPWETNEFGKFSKSNSNMLRAQRISEELKLKQEIFLKEQAALAAAEEEEKIIQENSQGVKDDFDDKFLGLVSDSENIGLQYDSIRRTNLMKDITLGRRLGEMLKIRENSDREKAQLGLASSNLQELVRAQKAKHAKKKPEDF